MVSAETKEAYKDIEEKGIAILPRDKQQEYIEKLFGAIED